MKVAVLCPEYSYSHLAGRNIFSDEDLNFYERIEDIFTAVTTERAAKGIIPIENMIEGTVRESIKGLLKHTVKVNEAYTMPIHHCLAAQGDDYQIIISHPQALSQCSAFLAGKKIMESMSTAKAMKTAAEDHRYAAIGSREAAEYHSLPILKHDIEDNHDNVTRFLVISLEELIATGENTRTSILLKPKEDKPGLLFYMLAPFAVQNINLAKIESLPSGRKMGEYVFYVEIDGSVQEERVKSALNFLRNSVDVHSLGSYQVKDLKL